MKSLFRIVLTVGLMMFWTMSVAANQPLCDEITLDPLGRGYASMTAEQIHTDLHTEYRSRFRDQVNGSELFEGIDPADWVAQSESNRTLVLQILALGDIDPRGNARTLLIGIFGGGSQTISNMAAIATELISRVDELQLGRVKVGDVVACGG